MINIQAERLRLDDYQKLEELGQGSFGSVYRVLCISPNKTRCGHQFAMKIINEQKLISKKDRETLQNEENLLRKTKQFQVSLDKTINNHSYLLSYHEKFTIPPHKYLVLELAALGDMAQMITAYKQLPYEVIQYYLAQMVIALEQLHNLGFIHRDVKPSNFMLDRDGNIVLGDFGTAKQLEEAELRLICGEQLYSQWQNNPDFKQQLNNSEHQRNPSDFEERARGCSLVGTVSYFAPELMKNGATFYGPLDIWSLGCIAFEMATGQQFKMQQQLTNQRNTRQLKFEQIKKIKDEDLQQFIHRCLQENPINRFDGGWPALKQMKYFKKIDFTKLHQIQLINTTTYAKQLEQFKQTHKIFETFPLIQQRERLMYPKLKPYLAIHEIPLFALENIQITIDEKQLLSCYFVITDFSKLLVVNQKQNFLEMEYLITSNNFFVLTQQNSLQDYQQQNKLQPSTQLYSSLYCKIYTSVNQYNNMQLISFKLNLNNNDYIQFIEFYKTNFNNNKKLYGYKLCINCNNYSLNNDICIACGFQLVFINKQFKKLNVLQKYFPKHQLNVSEGENQKLQRYFEIVNSQQQFDISMFFQRKNRLFICKEQLQAIFDIFDYERNVMNLQYNESNNNSICENQQQAQYQSQENTELQLQNQENNMNFQSIVQRGLQTPNKNVKPLFVGLSSQQHTLRQLLAKIYWFSERWLQHETATVFPRISAMFTDNFKFNDETLQFLVDLSDKCFPNSFDEYLYLNQKEDNDINITSKQQDEINMDHVRFLGSDVQEIDIDF